MTVVAAAVTGAFAAATGAFAAADVVDVTVDVTVPAALTAVPDAVASDWVVLSSAWLAPVTVAATVAVAAWPVRIRAERAAPSTTGVLDVTADVSPSAAWTAGPVALVRA